MRDTTPEASALVSSTARTERTLPEPWGAGALGPSSAAFFGRRFKPAAVLRGLGASTLPF